MKRVRPRRRKWRIETGFTALRRTRRVRRSPLTASRALSTVGSGRSRPGFAGRTRIDATRRRGSAQFLRLASRPRWRSATAGRGRPRLVARNCRAWRCSAAVLPCLTSTCSGTRRCGRSPSCRPNRAWCIGRRTARPRRRLGSGRVGSAAPARRLDGPCPPGPPARSDRTPARRARGGVARPRRPGAG